MTEVTPQIYHDWPCLRDFVSAMSGRLHDNRHKAGWKKCTYVYLYRCLLQELTELMEAIEAPESAHNVTSEAADVANFAMMIADVYAGQNG